MIRTVRSLRSPRRAANTPRRQHASPDSEETTTGRASAKETTSRAQREAGVLSVSVELGPDAPRLHAVRRGRVFMPAPRPAGCGATRSPPFSRHLLSRLE
ncbi:hypothetical protein EYF80_068128 [Liparis tanakae]|uniref:Uncharacterized protein n=1 Tax=Liparis tanakae TaxID=230148 RepID=A0A4Z2DYY8_9TELE|nr:hypothetical protein EYF80_068128 [Liparis tanakae]